MLLNIDVSLRGLMGMTEQTITIKVTDKDLIEILTKGVAELKEENIILKKELDDASKLLDGLTIPELLELVKSLNEENKRLRKELDHRAFQIDCFIEVSKTD